MTKPGLPMADTPLHKTQGVLTDQLGSRANLLADLRYERVRHYQNDGCRIGRASDYAVTGAGESDRLYRQVELQAGM